MGAAAARVYAARGSLPRPPRRDRLQRAAAASRACCRCRSTRPAARRPHELGDARGRATASPRCGAARSCARARPPTIVAAAHRARADRGRAARRDRHRRLDRPLLRRGRSRGSRGLRRVPARRPRLRLPRRRVIPPPDGARDGRARGHRRRPAPGARRHATAWRSGSLDRARPRRSSASPTRAARSGNCAGAASSSGRAPDF